MCANYRYYRKNWEFFECPNLTQENYTNWVYYNTLLNVWDIISKTDGGAFRAYPLGNTWYYTDFDFGQPINLKQFRFRTNWGGGAWAANQAKMYAMVSGNWVEIGTTSGGLSGGQIDITTTMHTSIIAEKFRVGILGYQVGNYYAQMGTFHFWGKANYTNTEITKEEYEAHEGDPNYFKVLIPNNLHTIQTPKYLERIERLYPSTTQVGTSVNISDTTGIARGFTTDSYLKYNIPAETFTPADGSDFEVQLAFKLPEGATGGQLIGSSTNRYHLNNSDDRTFWQYAGIQPIVSRDKIVVNLLNEHTYGYGSFTRTDIFYTANIAYNFDTTTTYIVNIKKVGTKYTTVLTDVNNTFTRTYSAENVNVVNNRNDLIGANLYIEGGSSSVFNGQIDLKNSFIKKKGNYFWTNLEVFESGMMPQIHNIAIYKYLNATETEEDIADYVKNSQPSISISGLTNLTEEQSKTIINGERVTSLTSTGSYTSVYTFSDDISINSLEFCTGYNGDGYGYLSRVTVEVYKDSKWNIVYDNTAEQGGWNETVGAYGKYISTPFTALINNTTYSNMYRVTLHGMNQVLGGISYYGWINNFKLNVSKKNIISAGRVPQYYNIIRNELEQ